MHIVVFTAVRIAAGSARPYRSPTDAAAVEMALSLPYSKLDVVHVGDPLNSGLNGYLGMGIPSLTVLAVDPDGDPYPAMCKWLEMTKPDLILFGGSARSGEGDGYLPYAIAGKMNVPILNDTCEILSVDAQTLILRQALPKARRRDITITLPAVLTVSSFAKPGRQSAYGKARKANVHTIKMHGLAGFVPVPVLAGQQDKPSSLQIAAAGKPKSTTNARDRLKQLSTLKTGKSKIIHAATADDAVNHIIEYLKQHKMTTE